MTPLAALTALSLLGYHLTFDAEMSSQADMSQFINTYANGNTWEYANDEEEAYVPYDATNPAAPYVFANGALTITASPNQVGTQPYTSGMIETSGTFTQSSGYFEIRATTPAGQGFWPAFWLLPAAYYPEIDILEQPNNSGTDTEYWTHTNSPTDSSGGFSDTGVDVTHGYHRYGFLWTANSIQYVFDGSLIGYQHPLPPSMVGLPMYLIANLAVGGPGSWPGNPLAGASSTFSIDYIRVYSNDPTVPAVSQEPDSPPDGAATLPTLTPPPVAAVAVGRGPDQLVLQVSEDAYQGDAQFTVTVDGKQQGGVLTALANHACGQTQAFTFSGGFGVLHHTATVNFLNDHYDSGGDRNLFVVGASLNGVPVQNATLTEDSAGPQSFGFVGRTLPPISIGSGPDAFTLSLSQVPNTQNARFFVEVDGVLQGALMTATALRAWGQAQTVVLHGHFGPAAHKVTVGFGNGASGSDSGAAVLYLNGLSYDGFAAPNASAVLTQRGFVALTTAAITPDTLSIGLAEDAWQGDAQAQISVDGVVLGTQTVTASNASGGMQTLSYAGSWGGAAVPHAVTVDFLNDAYGAPGQDRNLHVASVALDGRTIGSQLAMMRGGPVAFGYAPPSGTPGWVSVSH